VLSKFLCLGMSLDDVIAAATSAPARTLGREDDIGALRPGDPVGTESELVKQFGVNRSTVREGIRLLRIAVEC
jgi:GntR family transcriptional regulator, transcriptional repressor for pyruvate dehydrogenase complex